MRLRIVRPLPPEIEGLQVGHLRFGASYEITHPLCELLLLMGYGVPVDEPPDSTAAEKPITRKRSTPPIKDAHGRASRTQPDGIDIAHLANCRAVSGAKRMKIIQSPMAERIDGRRPEKYVWGS